MGLWDPNASDFLLNCAGVLPSLLWGAEEAGYYRPLAGVGHTLMEEIFFLLFQNVLTNKK